MNFTIRRILPLIDQKKLVSDRYFSIKSRSVISDATAKLIDGKKLSQEIRKELRAKIDEWTKKGNKPPSLLAILVGTNAASQTYVKNKMLAAKDVGIKSTTIELPETIQESDLIAKIKQFNADPEINGILVQLPVPGHINERTVCNAVDPRKDVDGFHVENIGKLTLNMDTLVPATALGVVEIIKRHKIETHGKNIVICGRSKNVGLPIALLLHSDAGNELNGMEATVVLCHRNTPPQELLYFTKRADIVITATGVVGLIKPEMLKEGAVVIDVGINQIQTETGKKRLVGDADFEGCLKVARLITPVPGGVGPMTVACLMTNTFKAAQIQTIKLAQS